MISLSFKQTPQEFMVRVAATIVFESLRRSGCPEAELSSLTEKPQYGFTASASSAAVGPRFVRITDLQDGRIEWECVPYCECGEPDKYRLGENDLLFARTGATTGKTVLVTDPEESVFASYLIRVRPRRDVLPEYLYAFFQSDVYWAQLIDEKEGSAQPNCNGAKLSAITIPLVGPELQAAIGEFLRAVRARQEKEHISLPEMPAPLAGVKRIVAKVEELAARIEEARGLREHIRQETDFVLAAGCKATFEKCSWPRKTVAEIVGSGRVRNGKSLKETHSESPIRCLRLSAITDGRIDCSDAKPVPMTVAQAEPYLVRTDDAYVMRGNGSKHLVGRAAIAEKPAAGTIFPDLLICIPLQGTGLMPAFFVAFWNSPGTRQKIEEMAKTTSGIWKINQGHVESLEIPLTPLPEQRRIVAYLDGLQAKVDALKALQAQTAAELDALLPSVLDKAFKGEL
jgi:type I restriction enzyme, S subunit